MGLQPIEERQRISRFHFKKDAKLALAGRTLLQHAASTALNQPFGMILFGRTAEGKPYVKGPDDGRHVMPWYNLNLSHHGSWAVVAAEESCLVGTDVMTVKPQRMGEDAETFLNDFVDCLTGHEWNQIRKVGRDSNALLFAFFVFWALKESYIKAVGIGLGLSLTRIEFDVEEELLSSRPRDTHGILRRNAATMKLDGVTRSDWSFEVGQVDEEHVMAVACGPLSDAIGSFMQALRARAKLEEPPSRRGDIPGEVQLKYLEFHELLGQELGEAYGDGK